MVEYELDTVFVALAHPVRRAILGRLAGAGTATVTEIAAPFDVSLNAVSKHLKVLERAGLIRREVLGREHHCRFDPAPLDAAGNWIGAARAFWEGALDGLAAHLAKTTGGPSGSAATADPGEREEER